ncbi:hypothetical protein Gotri_001146 [Gossypium trilobum]|uniref:Uncharacterized protein n=1 Tax=Gossypium trilobum TaxID=34281 RepID=A0A7J9FE21_9ROSI|nr:hypothetical protein [Gossypium trilobum]
MGETPLTFYYIYTFFARELGLFNKVESDRLSGKYVRFVAKKGFLMDESITQVTEKNVVVRDWSLRTQKAKGDRLRY